MKKCAFLVASAVVCASASALADNVQGGNVFGVMAVESKSADTIVAVPWCECSTNDNESVSISNIVKTANLTVGDELYSLNSSREKLYKWVLTEGANGVKYWNGIRTVVESGSVEDLPVHAHAARGTAIILHRQNPMEGASAKKFYLYGQVGTGDTVSPTIEAGVAGESSVTPAYTLIAPPGTNDVDVLVGGVLTGVGSGDSIVVRGDNGVNREFKYDGTNWGYDKTSYNPSTGVSVSRVAATSIVLKQGTGAWYVSRNTTAPTLTWTDLPKK